MRELQAKQRTKKRIYSIPVLAILMLLTAAVAKGTYGVMKKRAESARHVETLKAKIAELDERKLELNKNIERLSTPEGVDREIKEKFSVSKEGEQVAIIVDESINATATNVSDLAWYSRLWNTIKGLWED